MGYIILFSMEKNKLCLSEFNFLCLFIDDLLFATCYRVETEIFVQPCFLGVLGRLSYPGPKWRDKRTSVISIRPC